MPASSTGRGLGECLSFTGLPLLESGDLASGLLRGPLLRSRGRFGSAYPFADEGPLARRRFVVSELKSRRRGGLVPSSRVHHSDARSLGRLSPRLLLGGSSRLGIRAHAGLLLLGGGASLPRLSLLGVDHVAVYEVQPGLRQAGSR